MHSTLRAFVGRRNVTAVIPDVVTEAICKWRGKRLLRAHTSHELVGTSLPLSSLRTAAEIAERDRIGVRERTSCAAIIKDRSEEHTSELQSRRDLVCRL